MTQITALAIYVVVRRNHETEVLRFRAWYGVTEKRSVTVDTRSLKAGNTMAVILWSLNTVTEHFSPELLPSAGATENVAEFRSQTVVVSSGYSHEHCIADNDTFKNHPS